jgi:hypothetical protein
MLLRGVQRRRRFKLIVEAQEMLVDYTPNYMSGSFPVGHFEFRSLHQPPRCIPVSETGYRSHFAPMPDIETEASPQEYARLVALAFIRRAPAPRYAMRTTSSLHFSACSTADKPGPLPGGSFFFRRDSRRCAGAETAPGFRRGCTILGAAQKRPLPLCRA